MSSASEARTTRTAARTAVIYCGAATLWLFATEILLGLMLESDRAFRIASLIAGITFIGTTAWLLFGYAYREESSVAIANETLHAREAELRRQTLRIDVLHDIDAAILRETRPDELGRSALRRLRALVRCQRISLSVFDHAVSRMRMIFVEQDAEYGPAEGASWPFRDVIPHELLASDVVAIPDLASFPRWPLLDRLFENGIKSILFAPMVSTPPALGALVLSFTEAHAFGEEDVTIAKTVADQLAIAFEQEAIRAQLHDRVDDLRRSDAARRELHAQLVNASEMERRRIADDIHDDPVQVLTALGLRLAAVAARTPDDKTKDELDRLEDVLSRATVRLRAMMFDLRPPDMETDGLGLTVRKLATRMFDEDVTIRVVNELSAGLSLEASLTAYRITLEALTNVRKHARASKIELGLRSLDGGVLGTIADDGVGVRGPTEQGHVGIETMRQRAESAGGWWRLGSSSLGGVEVSFWIPAGLSPIELPTAG